MYKYDNIPFIICVIFLFSNCTSNEKLDQLDSRAIETLKEPLENDSVDIKCTDYYDNGEVKSVYYMKDNLYHGPNMNFYSNGIKESEGNWYKGTKIGFFKYYDETGKIHKIVEFIRYRDSVKSRPNQIFKIGNHYRPIKKSEV